MNDQTRSAGHEHVEGLLAGYAAGSLDEVPAELVRQHLVDCPDCRSELAGWEEVGAAVRLVATATPAPSRGTLDRVLDRIERGELEPAPIRGPRWYERIGGGPFRRPLGAGLAAAVLAAAVLLTPVGSYAQGLLARFQPQQFVAVPVTVADLRSLPSLEQFGEFQGALTGKPRQVTGAPEAAAAAGMKVLTPGWLPSDVPSGVSYAVIPGQTARFTFDSAKARATAAKQGKTLPSMSAGIDGSSLQITIGTSVVAVYGDPAALEAARRRAEAGRDGEAPKTAGAAEPGAAKGGGGRPEAGLPDASEYPRLVIAQSLAPSVTATGASVPDLERYVLSLPGVSPELANAIRAIGDPTTTWPIPLPVQQVSSHPVRVRGANGLAIGDSTGLGSGVVWVADGVVHAVGGTYKESEILRIAESLH
ncbi:MAG TPA: zf-HC2 domain-containing protein [Chloroflexota bacterium]|jgi:anti-sigma factor RsiW